MPYDEALAARVRTALAKQPGVTERKMFGGIAFMVHRNMACGVASDALMVRVGADQYDKLLAQPGVRPMDFTGRPMKGFLYVDANALGGRGLSTWVKRAVKYAGSLPTKDR
jgi:TfoX/Sxy family transcriptional regulator of competence genes